MIKTLFYLISALLMSSFFSCSQDSDPYVDPTPSSKMQEVTINVAGVDQEFGVETSPGLRSVSLKDANVKSLHYLVYDDKGKLVKMRTYLKDKVVSQIKDTLNVGKYRVVIMTANVDNYAKNFEFDGPINEFKTVPYSDLILVKTSRTDNPADFYNSDLFNADFELNVTTAAQPAMPITLSRMVGKVRIVPTDLDKMPSYVTGVKFISKETSENCYRFNTKNVLNKETWATPYNRAESYALTPTIARADFLKVTNDNPVSFTMFPVVVDNPHINKDPYKGLTSAGIIYVQFICTAPYSLPEFIIKSKYEVKANQTLKLTGKLFNSVVGSDIVVNDTWDSTIINSSFD